MTGPVLRPLGVGDIVDRVIALYRADWRLFLVVSAVPNLVVIFLTNAFTLAFPSAFLGGDELLGPQLRDALLVPDLGVHLGLGVGGLVRLVVSEAAIADQVDEYVVSELLAECERQANGADGGSDVVGVDVDDGHVEALGHVGCPLRRTGVIGIGGEANLVVGDQMDGAAHLVTVECL